MYDLLTLTLVVIVLALWLRWRKKRLQIFEDLGIPGPKPNMICGNMFPIYQKGLTACWQEWSAKYGKVYGYYLGFKPILYVGDTELLKKIQIKDFQLFINRPGVFGDQEATESLVGGKALTNEQAKRWKELRSILAPSFTTAKMKTMAPMMNQVVKMLVANIDEKAENGEYFDIFDCYQKLTLDVIGRAAFGIDSDVQKEPDNRILRLGRIFFSTNIQSNWVLLAASFPEFRNLNIYLRHLRNFLLNKGSDPIQDMGEFVKAVIEKRRKNPELRRPDLLQLMLDAEGSEGSDDASTLTAGEDDETIGEEPSKKTTELKNKLSKRLNDDEVKSNSIVFFLAGYETTSNLMGYSTFLLAQHPDIQDKVRAEVLDLLEREGELSYGSLNQLKYLDQVLSESLRIFPPVIFFVNREAMVDVTYGNLRIPKGMAVQVPTYDLHHNPEYWENPDEFRPERFAPENRSKINSMAYQPFGAGPRNCVGLRFAQMEAKIAMAHILKNFEIELSPQYIKEPLELRSTGVTRTPTRGIYVRALRRN